MNFKDKNELKNDIHAARSGSSSRTALVSAARFNVTLHQIYTSRILLTRSEARISACIAGLCKAARPQ